MTALTRFGRRAATLATATAVGASVAVLGAGQATAATPPSISVGFSGADKWTVTWDGTPATTCAAHLRDTEFPANVAATATLASGTTTSDIAPGPNTIRFVCDGKSSNTVTIYGPRGALNDLRTTFSNDTQGMFGS